MLQLLARIDSRGRVLLDQLEPFERQRVQPNVKPLIQASGRFESERTHAVPRFDGEQVNGAADLAAG